MFVQSLNLVLVWKKMVLWIQQEYTDDTHPSMLFIGYICSPLFKIYKTMKYIRKQSAGHLLKRILNYY